MPLLFVVFKALGKECGLQLCRLAVEIIAEGFQRVELIVAKQHVHGGNEHCGVLGKVVHGRLNELKNEKRKEKNELKEKNEGIDEIKDEKRKEKDELKERNEVKEKSGIRIC